MTAPKKSLGQNFLMHQQTAARIVEAAGVRAGDAVLEIGPGTGMLTRELLAAGARVTAVETDEDLLAGLEEAFAGSAFTLIHADIRAFDPKVMRGPYALVANIPYYITGEIIRMFLEAEHQPTSMTLLVQKEVAERIARSKKESLLSVSVKTYGVPKYQFTVPRGAFKPAPKVDSAVLAIQNIQNPFPDEASRDRFFDIVRTGFMHKRKLLLGNLGSLYPIEQLKEAFTALGIPERARAEDVSHETWKNLADTLS